MTSSARPSLKLRRHLPVRRVTESHAISLEEIRALAATRFGDMIKGVVDLERGILLLDDDLHADQEAPVSAEVLRSVRSRRAPGALAGGVSEE